MIFPAAEFLEQRNQINTTIPIASERERYLQKTKCGITLFQMQLQLGENLAVVVIDKNPPPALPTPRAAIGQMLWMGFCPLIISEYRRKIK